MRAVEEIVAHILRIREKCYLPGIGILTLERRSAAIIGDSITPPKHDLSFTPYTSLNDQALLYELEEVFGDQFDYSSWVEKFKSFRDELFKKGEHSLFGVGVFELIDENINFKPYVDEVAYSFLSSLPTLSLPQSLAKTTSNQKPKRRWLLWLILAVALIAILFNLMVYLFPNIWNASDYTSDHMIQNERTNVNPKTVLTSYVDSSESNPVLLEKNGNISEVDGVVKNNQETDIDIDVDENPISTINEKNVPANNELHGTEKESLDCVVVVGAFSNASNVDRMIANLKKEGFQTYTENKGGLTRVGVQASCVSDKLDSVLSLCRREIENEAWILND